MLHFCHRMSRGEKMYTLLYFFVRQCFFVSFVKTKAFALPLDESEEAKCLEELAQGSKQAREKLINHNLRLVAHVAKKYENNIDDMEDLISIGTIGLIKAIDSYKNDQKTRLATYAARCINNEILMHLRTNKKRSLDISLNESVGKDKDGSDILLEDIIESPQKEMSEIIELSDNIRALKKHLEVLDEREKQIIIWRYGLLGHDTMTQKEIAKTYQISRSYVSRIEKRALMKLLREFMKGN